MINNIVKHLWKSFSYSPIAADPLFADPANDDYSLKPDSPALKLGFGAIDMSGVELRDRGK